MHGEGEEKRILNPSHPKEDEMIISSSFPAISREHPRAAQTPTRHRGVRRRRKRDERNNEKNSSANEIHKTVLM